MRIRRLFLLISVLACLLSPIEAGAAPSYTWIERTTTVRPTARYGHGMAYDSLRHRAIMFGGENDSAAVFNDTWAWDGLTWSQINTATSPAPRASRLVYDIARDRIVMFGGLNASGRRLNETWEFDGSDWIQRFPAMAPTPRIEFGMVYDAVAGHTLLFGGYDGAASAETWKWDGTAWSRMAPPSSPSARYAHSMGYNSSTGRTLLFGGETFGGQLGDTWEWDGTTWIARAPVTSPSPRHRASLSYDPLRARSVLFGGCCYHNTTWEWDGHTWLQMSPTVSPPATAHSPSVYDTARAKIVMFGGCCELNSNDTWALSPLPVPPPVIQSPLEGAAHGTTSITIRGEATPGAAVTILEDSTEVGQGLADGAGSFAINVNFTQGAHSIVATADSSDASSLRSFVVDVTPPVMTMTRTTPAGPAGWTSQDVEFAVLCADEHSGVDECMNPLVVSGEGRGLIGVARASDRAGNEATLQTEAVHIDRTPPVTSADVSTGWSRSSTTVQLTSSDNLSGVATTAFSVDGGPPQEGLSVAISGDGVHSLRVWSVDVAGNVEPPTTMVVRIDGEAPRITSSVTPQPNALGWNRSPVTVDFDCSDAHSGIVSCGPEQIVSEEGRDHIVNGVATDAAGNTATIQALVHMDRTPPSISAHIVDTPNSAGWFDRPVMVAFSCADDLSGIASCSPPDTAPEGAAVVVQGDALDAAGNAATARTTALNIDLSPPTATLVSATPAPNASGWRNGQVTVTWSCSDGLSGVAQSHTTAVVSTEGRDQLAEGICTDIAGNTTSVELRGINIDVTGPAALFASHTPSPNDAGWNRSTATVKWFCADSLSGVTAPEAATVVASEGQGQIARATCQDKAGNATQVTRLVNVDNTAAAGLADGGRIAVGTMTGSATDNLSGVKSVTVRFEAVDVDRTYLRTAQCVSGCGERNVRWSVATFGMLPGRYAISAAVVDVADNPGNFQGAVEVFVL